MDMRYWQERAGVQRGSSSPWLEGQSPALPSWAGEQGEACPDQDQEGRAGATHTSCSRPHTGLYLPSQACASPSLRKSHAPRSAQGTGDTSCLPAHHPAPPRCPTPSPPLQPHGSKTSTWAQPCQPVPNFSGSGLGMWFKLGQ